MFLLLAPSPLTGKRPGLYCPRGQRSQDAPKGPNGELRGWMPRLDKKLHAALFSHTSTDPLNKAKMLKSPFLPRFCLTVIHFQQYSGISGNGQHFRDPGCLL